MSHCGPAIPEPTIDEHLPGWPGWMCRRRPDFLIIGAQKSGTTSLLNYLRHHPSVAVPRTKELKYFDVQWSHGVRWYARHFPLHPTAAWRARQGHGPILVGEKSPSYLFYPAAPARAHALLPHARLIALLRDPVDRAVSHYQHNHRRKRETLSFEDALDREREHLGAEFARHAVGGGCADTRLMHWSYLARGRYAEQLERWYGRFPRAHVLVLRAEDLFREPGATFERVQEFLGLSRWMPDTFDTHNPSGGYDPISRETRARLRDYFAPHNERLRALVGPDMRWD